MKAQSTSSMRAGCSPRWRKASSCLGFIRRMTNPRRVTPSGASGESSALFFSISKVLSLFALPSNDILAAGLIGLALMPTRLARAGRGLVSASIILFLAFGLLPLGKMLIAPLEERFPAWDASGGAPDGIVVLGGAIETAITPVRPASELNEAAERIIVIAELARKYQSARVLYSGGNGSLVPRGGSEAKIGAALLEAFGVPARRLML